ncbi:MAG: hypothetical protein PHX52_01975 [Candidatus Pacebacteria bacterium]|nr:hypothetical protein [Candidatus Paceibacterota bacterium]MDD3919333.1 hypothetical protein [Candidatus Paceibacterota bacterium]
MKKYNKIFDRGIRDNDTRKRYPKRRDDNRRDSYGEEREMFEVICDDCGRQCKVPFKPSNDKPIYCSDCFENHRDSDRGGRRDSQRRDDRRSRDREMFDAVCDKCGKSCKLPFKPSPDKPIFCDECFKEEGGKNKGGEQYKEQFEALNNKLDKIMEALNIIPTAIEEIKAVEEIEVAPKKEKKAKKTTKKVVAKKKTSKKK